MKTIEEIKQYYGSQLAKYAFELGAIRLSPDSPFTWASGYRMPIYNDNRRLLSFAQCRALICDAFSDLVTALKFDPDNVAGTATAGIPHATSLADRLRKPLSYVRSSAKDHGLGHQIEGLGPEGSYEGAAVLLIEDLISTGKSSLQAVDAIKEANGKVPYTLAIFSYGLPGVKEAFAEHECEAHTILDYSIMVATAVESGYINDEEAVLLHEWREDPFGWGEKHGYRKIER